VVAYFTVATVVQSGVRDEQALVIGDVVVFRQNLSAGPIDDLAYPKLGYRQRLTTWKKNGRRAPSKGARSKPILTTGFVGRPWGASRQTLRSTSDE